MKILSLFDGISAAQQAFKNLGIEFNGADNIYYSSEIDKYAIKNTQHNFPNTVQLGDVNNVNFADFTGNIDLLCAGFPCQPFSSAGNAKGFDDERGMLFFKVVEAMQTIKPKYVLFENVNSMKKKYKDILTKHVGFDFTMINSALVTAQNRKRIYYVGALQEDGTYRKIDISQPEDKHIYLKDILETGLPYQDKSHALTASYNGAVFWNSLEKKQRTMIAEPVLYNQYNERTLKDKSGTLTTVTKDNLILEPSCPSDQNFEIYIVKNKTIFYRGKYYKIDLPDGECFVRKLTINECCRLQDFPDGFVDILSKTQGYKALGNSFTVGVIEHILKHLTF